MRWGICLEVTKHLPDHLDDPNRPIDNLESSNEGVPINEFAANASCSPPDTGSLPFNAWGISRLRHDLFLSHRPNCARIIPGLRLGGAFEKGHLERKDL